ncbi:DUF4235 domain-containing protein [Streptomyces mirabilis]|uniref:DUF4235 domain-containing protein n=1 Tax=Streptomyces mirabilis TaxID=68239 RepID=UPI0033339BBF
MEQGRLGSGVGVVLLLVKTLGHDEDAPDATDEERTWRETMLAAVLQGAIFAGVKAAVDRAGAAGTRRLTGTWPG